VVSEANREIADLHREIEELRRAKDSVIGGLHRDIADLRRAKDSVISEAFREHDVLLREIESLRRHTCGDACHFSRVRLEHLVDWVASYDVERARIAGLQPRSKKDLSDLIALFRDIHDFRGGPRLTSEGLAPANGHATGGQWRRQG
jgi:hypothetical protein